MGEQRDRSLASQGPDAATARHRGEIVQHCGNGATGGEQVTLKSLSVMLGFMVASAYTYGQSYYRVDLEPDTAKRRTVPIEFGAYSAELHLYSSTPWLIGGSHITAPTDGCLWSGP